jgi:hypothetical protein
VRLNEIHDEFKDRVEICCVYIKEAHPTDGRVAKPNVDEGIFVESPKNDDERADVASTCILQLNFKFRMVIDNMGDEVEHKYMALPDRLYLVDSEGIINWKSGPGPHYFNIEEWYQAIKKLVS